MARGIEEKTGMTGLTFNGMRLKFQPVNRNYLLPGVRSEDEVNWWGLMDKIRKQSKHELYAMVDTYNAHIAKGVIIRAALRQDKKAPKKLAETIVVIPKSLYMEAGNGWAEDHVDGIVLLDRSGRMVAHISPTRKRRQSGRGALFGEVYTPPVLRSRMFESGTRNLLRQAGAEALFNSMFDELREV